MTRGAIFGLMHCSESHTGRCDGDCGLSSEPAASQECSTRAFRPRRKGALLPLQDFAARRDSYGGAEVTQLGVARGLG